MGIRSFIKKIFTPKKAAAVARESSGEIRIGESDYTIASRRWKLFKSPRLRRAGIFARRSRKGLIPEAWFRPLTARRIPKPRSYKNAGAGRKREHMRTQAEKARKEKAKKAA